MIDKQARPLKRQVTEQVEYLQEKRGKVEEGRQREKEWLRRVGRNPRYVFGPKAPFTTARGKSLDSLSKLLCGPKALGWGHQTCWKQRDREVFGENREDREIEEEIEA